jgi:ribosomal protein S18 acetylase RimI-like enzyme
MAETDYSLKLYGGLALRLARPADRDFLLDLFIASRPWLDFTSQDREFVREIFEQQYRALQAGLEHRYPEHLDFVLERTGQAVGRVILDLAYTDWRLSELQIHPLARGKGIGSDLVRSLQTAAAGSAVPITLATLMVLTRAQSFYRRLGFRVVGHNPPSVELAWFPPQHPGAAAPAGQAQA